MSLSPRLRAQLLQVEQDAERALVQLREGHDARIVFAVDVADAARHRAVGLQQLDEGVHFLDHRSFQFHLQRVAGAQVDLRLELERFVRHVAQPVAARQLI